MDPINSFIEAGAAGLIIVVVIMFLRYLAEERSNRTKEHGAMLDFIGEQRRENNATVASLATAISVSLGGVTAAIDNLRNSTVEHHQLTEDAVVEMRERIKQRRNYGSSASR